MIIKVRTFYWNQNCAHNINPHHHLLSSVISFRFCCRIFSNSSCFFFMCSSVTAHLSHKPARNLLAKGIADQNLLVKTVGYNKLFISSVIQVFSENCVKSCKKVKYEIYTLSCAISHVNCVCWEWTSINNVLLMLDVMKELRLNPKTITILIHVRKLFTYQFRYIKWEVYRQSRK